MCFFSLVWYWMRLSAVPELNFALCFYNLFHIYASFRRFDVKPCIKWPSTSIHIRSLAALFPECDTTQQRMFRLAFTSWKQFRTEGEERKNSFSSLIGLFFPLHFDALLFFISFGILGLLSLDRNSSYIVSFIVHFYYHLRYESVLSSLLGFYLFGSVRSFSFSWELFFVFNAHFSVIRFGPPSKVKCFLSSVAFTFILLLLLLHSMSFILCVCFFSYTFPLSKM